MTKNIKFRLVKFEKALAFQVLEMNEGFRKWFSNNKFLFNQNFVVESITCPSLYDDSVALRGNDEDYDFDLAVREFKNNALRDEYAKTLICAIQAACDAYQNTLPTEDCGNKEIFEF